MSMKNSNDTGWDRTSDLPEICNIGIKNIVQDLKFSRLLRFFWVVALCSTVVGVCITALKAETVSCSETLS